MMTLDREEPGVRTRATGDDVAVVVTFQKLLEALEDNQMIVDEHQFDSRSKIRRSSRASQQ
jgi:hypothetical protein